MITKPTVLILGAGASVTHGFPLGPQLKHLICAPKTDFKILDLAGYDLRELENFIETLRHSGYTSVDWFLEKFPEFIQIGKAAIAAILIPLESPKNLFANKLEDWYELLINILDSDSERFSENKLSIITFNYERSLEYYLLKTLTTRRRSEMAAIDALKNIEIVHVHGTLGELLPLKSTGRTYSAELTPSSIHTAVENITIVGEASYDARPFQEARNILSAAEKIIFLGFGYHPESIKRLGVFNHPWDDEKRSKIYVTGTSQNIAEKHWKKITDEILNGAYSPKNRVYHNAYNFLKEVEPFSD